MAVLVAAVVLVGVIGLLNLVFTLGVVRRLREHTALLETRGTSGPPSLILEPGKTVGDFSATTDDGEPVSRELLTEPTLVGFFSTTCSACLERLPEFADHAARHPGGPERVLGVVIDQAGGDARAAITGELAGLARVVRDGDGEQVMRAFAVQGFPAFAVVEGGGVVRASGYLPSVLAVGSPA
jgi:peroxiredoxin